MNDPIGHARSVEPSLLVEELYKTASNVPAEWAGMFRHVELGGGVSIGCMEGRARTDWEMHAQSQPMFCIAVMLDGQMRTALDGGATLDFRPGMVSLMSTRSMVSGWNRFTGASGFKIVDIRLTPEALREFTGQAVLPLHGKVLHDCSLPGLEAFMGCTPAPASLMRVANDVLSCRLETEMARRLYLHAKAQEALAIVFDGLELGRPSCALPVPADRQRLLQARALLEKDCGKAWTIRALADAVGLNEKRLQSGFQALFGQSVHACLTQIRMDAAANMLAQGICVTDTAYAIGFTSLSHFSKAFKKSKGGTPKHWALRHAAQD